MAKQQPIILVSRKDLPLSCAKTADEVWNMHPLVFLPLNGGTDKVVVCPYCDARYQLIDEE